MRIQGCRVPLFEETDVADIVEGLLVQTKISSLRATVYIYFHSTFSFYFLIPAVWEQKTLPHCPPLVQLLLNPLVKKKAACPLYPISPHQKFPFPIEEQSLWQVLETVSGEDQQPCRDARTNITNSNLGLGTPFVRKKIQRLRFGDILESVKYLQCNGVKWS